ncbi:unnamed protein product, partial [marine sediment metagenome]
MTQAQQMKQTLTLERKGSKDANYDYGKLYRERMQDFRKEKATIVRVKKPSNIPRARELGYKAKEGIIVARVRVRRGSGLHTRPKKGRRPKRMGITKLTRRISIQGIGEKKVNRKYPNMEVLNSYWVGEDGTHKYFEVILVDPVSKSIQKDKELNWIVESQHKNRADRGLTSAQRRSRGLHKKG